MVRILCSNIFPSPPPSLFHLALGTVFVVRQCVPLSRSVLRMLRSISHQQRCVCHTVGWCYCFFMPCDLGQICMRAVYVELSVIMYLLFTVLASAVDRCVIILY